MSCLKSLPVSGQLKSPSSNGRAFNNEGDDVILCFYLTPADKSSFCFFSGSLKTIVYHNLNVLVSSMGFAFLPNCQTRSRTFKLKDPEWGPKGSIQPFASPNMSSCLKSLPVSELLKRPFSNERAYKAFWCFLDNPFFYFLVLKGTLLFSKTKATMSFVFSPTPADKPFF